MASLTPSYGGISYERIDKRRPPVAVPDEGPSRHAVSSTRAASRAGKGCSHVIKFRPPAELPDAEYPFILSTGRTLYHYNVGNMTRKSAPITQKESRNFVEMHVADAERLGIADGGMARVVTRRGAVVVAARVSDKVRPGAIWMPFHFVEAPTNPLTNDAFDNVTRTAEYKCCAARVEACAAGA